MHGVFGCLRFCVFLCDTVWKHAVRVCVVQQQRQQLGQARKELKAAMGEKSGDLEELNEMKQALPDGREACEGAARIKLLEGEMEKAKESERKMLESLFSQTRQLEQAKMELEEAKLEIKKLKESIRGLEHLRSPNPRNLLRLLEKPMPSVPTQSQEEVVRIKRELKLAIEAEEKSKKAMDSLALALKEVTMEANRLTGKLSIAQSELKRVSAEADCLKSMLQAKEDKFQMVLAEVEQLRVEADESAAAWSAKEKVFISCIKVSEEEAAKVMQEKKRLLESQQAAREDNSKLRDIMKQALNEATVVKTGLEIARKENSQLKRLLSEKESSLEAIQQEHECLKDSEAAALESVEELKSLAAASSTLERSKSARSFDSGPFARPEAMEKQSTRREVMAKFPSERWRNDGPHVQNDGFHGPEARTASFHGLGSVKKVASSARKSMHRSFGCVSDMTVPSLCSAGKGKALNSDDSCCAEMVHLNGTSVQSGPPTKQKRKQILRKFDKLLRRKSLHNYERVTTPGSRML